MYNNFMENEIYYYNNEKCTLLKILEGNTCIVVDSIGQIKLLTLDMLTPKELVERKEK